MISAKEARSTVENKAQEELEEAVSRQILEAACLGKTELLLLLPSVGARLKLEVLLLTLGFHVARRSSTEILIRW